MIVLSSKPHACCIAIHQLCLQFETPNRHISGIFSSKPVCGIDKMQRFFATFAWSKIHTETLAIDWPSFCVIVLAGGETICHCERLLAPIVLSAGAQGN